MQSTLLRWTEILERRPEGGPERLYRLALRKSKISEKPTQFLNTLALYFMHSEGVLNHEEQNQQMKIVGYPENVSGASLAERISKFYNWSVREIRWIEVQHPCRQRASVISIFRQESFSQWLELAELARPPSIGKPSCFPYSDIEP